jgi:tRNA nucleotidyltransferase/poly(A) polymerase
MRLKDLLNIMQNIAKEKLISSPMICGGTPRDKLLGRLDIVSDLDITTGDKTVSYLAKELSIILSKKYNIITKTMDDGHSSIFIGNLKLDFSSNFNIPNIDKILYNIGIKDPTSMQKELYSRDFTCNALLMSLDLKNIYDILGRGIDDIKNKKISTCLDPSITLTVNKNRVIRSIYLSAKLDFDIDLNIVNWVSKNPESIRFASEKSMSEKLNKAMEYNPERTLYWLNKMNVWNYIPITESLYPYYIKHVKGK